MSVIATLNVGRNGATSKGGNSTSLSSPADRARFLRLHRGAGSYLLGRNSYTAERYSSAEAPIYILSRSSVQISLPISDTPVNDRVNDRVNVRVIAEPTLVESARAIYRQAPHPIVVEAGISLLLPLIESGCIEELELSISPIDGDDHFIDVAQLLSYFVIRSDETVDGTRLLKGRYHGDSAYRKDNS